LFDDYYIHIKNYKCFLVMNQIQVINLKEEKEDHILILNFFLFWNPFGWNRWVKWYLLGIQNSMILYYNSFSGMKVKPSNFF